MHRDHLFGIIFITISTFSWSLTGYFTRLVALDSMTIIAWRGLFGAISLIGVIVVFKGRNWHREFFKIGKPELIYIANTVFGTFTLITAYAYTSVAHSAVIYATIPFLAAFLGWLLLRELPTRSALLASMAALVGVAITVAAGSDGGLLGDALALAMTLSTALSIVLIRKYPTMSAMGSSCIAILISSVICLPFASTVAVTELQIFQLALFGFVNSALGVAFFALGSRRLPAVEAALISAIDTPLASFWVWIAFNEQAGWNTIVGGIIVIVAVIGHIVSTSRTRAPAR